MDRPIELRRAIESILSATSVPEEIVVSDDSRAPEPTVALCNEYATVRYVRGPQRGQGPNRQHGGLACSTDYVCFIDDDAIASKKFLTAFRVAAAEHNREKVIFTGDVLEGGVERKSPKNTSFWGTFEVEPKDRLENVNLNCNAFPRSAFRDASFDRHIKYGYEDADFCAQLIMRGYSVVHLPDIANTHLPSDINREYCYGFREHARYYTSLKRYALIRRRVDLAVLYTLAAPLQQVLHRLKTGRWNTIAEPFRDMNRALRDLIDEAHTSSQVYREVSGQKDYSDV